MTKEAGDDELSDMRSMRTPTSSQPHHQNYSKCVCLVCVFFLIACPEKKSQTCVRVVLCNTPRKESVWADR